jgi:hypothetical protein
MSAPSSSPPPLTAAELLAGLDAIRQSPRTVGTLEAIVRRPALELRELLTMGYLDPAEGLAGDNWKERPSTRTPDRSPHPDMQLTLMNVRVIALIAQQRDRWPLAGDQLYVDFDLSTENLPPGARLVIGAAVVEITTQPHTGCYKFAARFGEDALRWVNSSLGRELRLRGANARVIEAGEIRPGDQVHRLPDPAR